MRTTFLVALLLCGAALAGCTQKTDTPTPTPATSTPTPPTATTTPTVTTPTATPPTTPTAPTPGFTTDTFALATSGNATQVKTGERLNFTLYVNGTLNATTDHVGAHFANNTTAAPVAADMKACDHAGGALPGTFNVSCPMTTAGTWYVYGHARVNDSGTLVNWWSAPMIVHVRNFTLETSGFPATPQTNNQSFSFTLYLNGTQNVTTDHIGAHYWNATNAEPTTANATGACDHQAGGSTGVYAITCKIPYAGTGGPLSATPQIVYVRAHLRVTDGGTALSWWGPEQAVTVLAI